MHCWDFKTFFGDPRGETFFKKRGGKGGPKILRVGNADGSPSGCCHNTTASREPNEKLVTLTEEGCSSKISRWYPYVIPVKNPRKRSYVCTYDPSMVMVHPPPLDIGDSMKSVMLLTIAKLRRSLDAHHFM